jgi:hypothetical protein
LDSYFLFISQLNALNVFVNNKIGEHSLNTHIMMSYRDELRNRMASVFEDQISEFSTELQQMLLDDMVTAFESRLKVLNRADITRRFRY